MDEIPAELIKYAGDLSVQHLAETYNRIFREKQPIRDIEEERFYHS